MNITAEEIEQNKIESWEKELDATQGPDRPQVLDYSLWFSDDPQFSEPLSTYLPPAPAKNKEIHRLFRQFRDNLEGSILYPQIQSSKSMSKETALNYSYASSKIEDPSSKGCCSADLEIWYSLTGEEIRGPCELRQSWKYNDVTPRTYFSQGGDTFFASKYVRDIANNLMNTFQETNYKSKFAVQDLSLDRDTIAVIYDYSSFTSNLTELKYFLKALADFLRGTLIWIVDSSEGIIRVDAGDLVDNYNDTCNVLGKFTVQRYDLGDVSLWEHLRAGFLGVYGNIAFSTTLHGLHASQLCGDHGGARCVGDDAYITARPSADFGLNEIILAVQSLGEVALQKFRVWEFRSLGEDFEDDRTWAFLKRPIDRYQNRIIQEPNIFLPIFGLIHPIQDEVHTEEEDYRSRVVLLAKQTLSCLRQLKTLYPPLEEHQMDLIRRYLRSLYRTVGLDVRGRLPFETFQVKDKNIFTHLFVPDITGDIVGVDPWECLRYRFEDRSSLMLSIPYAVKEKVDGFKALVEDKGNIVENTMDRRLSYLVAMGWVEAEAMEQLAVFSFEEYRDFYEVFFRGDLRTVYSCRLLESAPSWVSDLDMSL